MSQLNSKFLQQIFGNAIGTKFALPCACNFMEYIETKFFKAKPIKPWMQKRFIDDVFFIWTDSTENLERF